MIGGHLSDRYSRSMRSGDADEGYLQSLRRLPDEADMLRLTRLFHAFFFLPAPLMASVMAFLEIGSSEPTIEWRIPLAVAVAVEVLLAAGVRAWAFRSRQNRLTALAVMGGLLQGVWLFPSLLLTLFGSSWIPFAVTALIGYIVLIMTGPTRTNVRKLHRTR